MAKTTGRPNLFLPGWDNEEHVSIGRNRDGDLELRFTGGCGGCRESFPDMQRTIQTIVQKTSMTPTEATAFYLGFTVGVDLLQDVLQNVFGPSTSWKGPELGQRGLARNQGHIR